MTPPDLKDCRSYDIFRKQLQIWELTTPVPEEKKGAIIAGNLPNDYEQKKDLKDKFFETADITKLASKDGLKLVRDFLDKELQEEDLDKQVRTWDEFEDCCRGSKGIEDFVSDFDRAYQKAASASGLTIPASVRAFMVLKRANLTNTQRMLVMSKLDQTNKEKMFENICRELKLVLGSGPGAGANKSSAQNDAIKVDNDLPSEEVLYAAGYSRRGGGGYRGRGGNGYSGGGNGATRVAGVPPGEESLSMGEMHLNPMNHPSIRRDQIDLVTMDNPLNAIIVDLFFTI